MSAIETGPDAPQHEQNNAPATETVEPPDNASGEQSDTNAGGDTFPRSYVEDLRKENADHRTKAKAAEDRADNLAKRLHAELVKATNRLENAADLPFDAEHLDDAERLNAALDALLADRPYYAKRAVKGDAGQGNRGSVDGGVDLLGLMRA